MDEYQKLNETRIIINKAVKDMESIQNQITSRMHQLAHDDFLMRQWECDAEKEYKKGKGPC